MSPVENELLVLAKRFNCPGAGGFLQLPRPTFVNKIEHLLFASTELSIEASLSATSSTTPRLPASQARSAAAFRAQPIPSDPYYSSEASFVPLATSCNERVELHSAKRLTVNVVIFGESGESAVVSRCLSET